MPTMPLKKLFKRKRRNKSSFRRKELSDEYNPDMEESEHTAQFSAKHYTSPQPKKDQSHSKFEAARRVFSPISDTRQQESRESSLTPEKISRYQPNESRGVHGGRDNSNIMHKIFPSNSDESTEVDIDNIVEEAPKEHHTPAKRNDKKGDFDGFWRERTMPHQRVAMTGSVVGVKQNNPGFGQIQSHDDFSAQSFAREDEDTSQYDEIDNRDYLIESDNESVEADASPPADFTQDQHPSNGFVSFGDNFFGDKGIVEQNTDTFTYSTQRKQEENDNYVSMRATPSMDNYLLRGTGSDSFLLGENLAPSVSEDFYAEETNISEHMSTNNSLIDNSVIVDANAESRQPDGRTVYSPSQFQNDFVKTVRHGWNYLEHTLAVDQNGLPIQRGEITKTVREGLNYLEHSLDQSLSAKSGDPEFDEMMMSFRQSWSYMTDDSKGQDAQIWPSSSLVEDKTLTSRQEELLSTVISNMSFFNDDSTAEVVEEALPRAPVQNTPSANEAAPGAPKDSDEILDDVLENWSLTSDNPTDPKEQNSSNLENEETINDPESTNGNGFVDTVRQTLSYLTDDNNEETNEESNEVQEAANQNGFMSTLRQTLSYGTENGDDAERDHESSIIGSKGKTLHTEKHEEKGISDIAKSWSFFSATSRKNDDSGSISDTSSLGSGYDVSAFYGDEMSADYSDAPSDEGDDGFSVGGHISISEGGVLDQVLDHWSYFAKAAGIPEDFDGYSTVSSYDSSISDESVTRRSKKSSSKNRRGEKSLKSRRRKRKSSKNRRRSAPKNVFGTGDDSESSVAEDKYPSNGIVVNIPLHPMITHTTEQIAGQSTTDKIDEGDVVPVAEQQVTSDPEGGESMTQPFDELPSKDESQEVTSKAKHDAESVSEEIVNVDSIVEVTQRTANDENEGETAKEGEMPASEEETGTDGVTGPVLVELAELEVNEENGKMRRDKESIESFGCASEGEYGKMSADEESIESLGCATATENVSVQSIEDADDTSAILESPSEVFDADDMSQDGTDLIDVQKESADGELAESGTVSESSAEFDDEVSYDSGSETSSEFGSEYDSEYTDEDSDESSSVGPIKRTYSASSMKCAALNRFGQPASETDKNTAAKVKSTKGQSGRVVDCQRYSKRFHRSRKKRTEGESEASRPNRRRLV